MRRDHNSLLLSLLLALIVITIQVFVEAKEPDEFYERPGILASEILRARGYLAEDLEITTQDGYILRITRGRNPLINNGKGGLPGRTPMLFIHGSLESSNLFLVNSFDAEPSDFSKVNILDYDLEELNSKLGDFPSAKSLPLLALDFGHEVFLLSRRGFPGSQRRVGDPLEGASDKNGNDHQEDPLTALIPNLLANGNLLQQIGFSLNSNFWKFSQDEQAKYDFPQVVDFIRNETGFDKIAMVTQSAGGSIALMALCLHPELNQKLSAVILWGEAFSPGNGPDLFHLLMPLLPILQFYVGAFPPASVTAQLQAVLGILCSSKLTQRTLCSALLDTVLGYSGGQAPMRPEFINSLFYTTSSHEVAQFLQAKLLGGQMHTFSNLLGVDAKPYNLSAITNTRLSFWVGSTDFISTPANVEATAKLLRVPYRFHSIKEIFNHNGYFFHNNNSRMAIIPTFREIYELGSESTAPPTAPPVARGRQTDKGLK